MRTILQKWWDGNTKVFSIVNHKKTWREVGNKPRVCFFTNGAKRKNGNCCFDAVLIVGYTIFNYTNFDLRKGRR